MTERPIAQQRGPENPIITAPAGSVTVLSAQVFLAAMAGLALRLLFVFRFPASAGDSDLYFQLSRSLVDHHVYGLWLNGQLTPTDLRMPGYPAFLAGVTILFRRAKVAISLSQALLDLVTCFLTAALAAALAPAAARRRVWLAGLWLAATCPFIANYSAVILTEVLVTFLTTAALVCFVLGLKRMPAESVLPIGSRRLTSFQRTLLGAFLTGLATLVRPEMPLLLATAGLIYAARWRGVLGFRKLLLQGVAMAGAFLLPLVPWAVRNFVTLHEVQFISPRYTTLPGEYAPVGYYAWTGTWLERYRDTFSSVWAIGEEPMNIDDTPPAAFDSPQEKTRVAALFDQYNRDLGLDISPEVDREFAQIAKERTRRHPLRTYVRVPFQRVLTLWFTPRVELLPIDGNMFPLRDQWQDSHANVLTVAAFAALGYLYIALAIAGIRLARRAGRPGHGANLQDAWNLWGIALLAAYVFVRTAFLTTVEAPEPRYVISCYPAVLAMIALLFAGRKRRKSQGTFNSPGN
ncbi:MAG: hypothetical protein LAO08_05125 [Acidobacteriia bacterium]|nr:hypothetical protein [Terriglobia bacterium]